jgi:uncharacterized OsmC-like protein
MSVQLTQMINGFDVDGLKRIMHGISLDPAEGMVKFGVTTAWVGGGRSATRVSGYELAGRHVDRSFTISCDEPKELLGTDTAANPQELLMAAFNACQLVGYVAGASLEGIELDLLEIHTEGELDMRGFLGLDETVTPGYDELHTTVRIKGNGTPEQFQHIHETVMATSPNRWNIANPIRLTSELVVE